MTPTQDRGGLDRAAEAIAGIAGDSSEARLAIRSARRHSLALVGEDDRHSDIAVSAFVASVLTTLWFDRDWPADIIDAVFDRVAATTGVASRCLRRAVADQVLKDPELLQMPPALAVESQLSRLLALGPMQHVSLWTVDDAGAVSCALALGSEAGDEEEMVALRLLDTPQNRPMPRPSDGLLGAPIVRWLRPRAALVARPRDPRSDTYSGVVEQAAAMLGPVLERDLLLRRNAAKERALVESSERRLERLGLDLHDGPLQDLAALVGEVRLLKAQLAEALSDQPNVNIITGRVDDVEARVVPVLDELRQLSHSLTAPTVLKRPLRSMLEAEAADFRSRTGIELELSLAGDLDAATAPAQRVALLRIVHEALTNVRDHSGASKVSVSVSADASHTRARISDDGRGFEVADTVADASRRGRLGLVGMSERARLLGGVLDIRSGPAGSTTIEVALPAFEAPAELEQRHHHGS